jgi:hypothetical protein
MSKNRIRKHIPTGDRCRLSDSHLKEGRKLAKRGRKKKEKPITQTKHSGESVYGKEGEEMTPAEDSNSENLDEEFEENNVDEPESVPEIQISSKDQGARLLEIRRAIEERADQRKFKDDLDYLDE